MCAWKSGPKSIVLRADHTHETTHRGAPKTVACDEERVVRVGLRQIDEAIGHAQFHEVGPVCAEPVVDVAGYVGCV